jgi:predicted heme/steroid binding protein/uncharacterized membrane protein
MKEFNLEELAQYNGENGNPIYIAHQGKVYDVTNSKLWKGGAHMKRHRSGEDLTTDLQAAPHNADVLERYPQVGVLKKEIAIEPEMPAVLSGLIKRYPMLRRHPHPMTVHFPIVFMIFTPVFNILYLITGVKSFEITALHCLGAGILFTVVASLTGYYTWWLNYFSQPMQAISIKKRGAVALFVLSIIAFIWRLADPNIFDSFRLASVIYFLIILTLFALVTINGWFGAHLTFPVEDE